MTARHPKALFTKKLRAGRNQSYLRNSIRNKILVKSYAKINLYLKILGRRADGYHDLDTTMQTVSLHDDLIFNEIKKGIKISCSNTNIPVDERNICFKAAQLIMKKFGIKKGISISIKKKIPHGAGLGGGSSNAAATLFALNKLWKLKLSKKQLIPLASKIGADVAFFIIGGKCRCKGVGSRVIGQGAREKKKYKENYYIIIKPEVSVPTKWAYEQWDKSHISHLVSRNNLTRYASRDTLHDIQKQGNDLEAVAIKKYPIIGRAKKDLINAGCSFAQMTGSGSAVFGVANNKTHGNKILKKLKRKYKKMFFVETVGK